MLRCWLSEREIERERERESDIWMTERKGYGQKSYRVFFYLSTLETLQQFFPISRI